MLAHYEIIGLRLKDDGPRRFATLVHATDGSYFETCWHDNDSDALKHAEDMADKLGWALEPKED